MSTVLPSELRELLSRVNLRDGAPDIHQRVDALMMDLYQQGRIYQWEFNLDESQINIKWIDVWPPVDNEKTFSIEDLSQ